MKILEPFAGYKLASGHALLHIAMFCGTFFVHTKEAQEISDDWETTYPKQPNGAKDILHVFYIQRYSHIAAIILSIPSFVEGYFKYNAMRIHNKYTSEIERDELNENLEANRVNRRCWGTFARFTEVMSVFII